jgi:putative ABC transport system permease protein
MARNWNITEGFFDALGVRPAIGRFFEAPDFVANAAPVVIISFESWQRRFGGDSHIVGRRIQLAGSGTTIVGVIPRGAAYPAGREFWSPKVFAEDERQIRGAGFYPVVGRLRAGVTRDAAQAELAGIATVLGREYPRTNATVTVTVVPMADNLVGGLRRTLWLLVGAVGLLLLVACANVANLLLTRTFRRSRELAIRAALGAGKGRVVRLLMVESVLLSVAGAVGGVLLARWGVAAIRALSPASLPRVDDIQVDSRALAFALVVSLATTVLFGLAPSLRAARRDPQDDLKAGGRAASTGREHRRVRNWIVAAEVALAVVLLTGAGLLVRSFVKLLSVERGYQANRVVMATMFTWQWNRGPAQLTGFAEQLVDRVGALPGVRAAAVTTAVPLSEPIGPSEGRFTIEGASSSAEGEAHAAHVSVATPEVFDVLRIPTRRGRLFTRADDAERTPVVVINDAMARRYFPNDSPIGKRISLRFAGPPVSREIIGVVGDVRQRSLEQEAPPAVFIPLAQAPTGSITLIARTASSAASGAIPAIRSAVKALNADLPIARTATLEGLTNDALRFRRFVLLLLGSFAITALSLAIVGVYGLIAQSAAERTQEIGVRIALGARTSSVLGFMMRQGLAPAAVGIVVGLALSAAMTRLLAGLLYDVAPLDAATFTLVPLGIVALVIAATSVPSWRATRVDPLQALRGS